ncbi:phytoene/squalene synthase family protein [Skermania sp. ID1734]|uniref:phytoene/squalene synthase family protein n=1 Tax=Skermania sp. ID1734 TaxID=2597516 RepID=UPI00117C6718|nr:phytoene/squalene synthase family protein [Skermania sp. ID1734]TSE01204.1 phytoene/squalene synthase family protein [Skermania sp. ID1734]
MAELTAAFEHCRSVTAEHGRTYYLATRLLPREQRRAVYALYAFARTVDDIVDTPTIGEDRRAERVEAIEKQLRRMLESGGTDVSFSSDLARPTVLATFATINRYGIDPQYLWDFLRSMRMDVPGTAEYCAEYATMAELRGYMYGSAAVIGLELLPVLGTAVPAAEAAGPAAALGEAFQLTNFIRDVGEDLDRGRIYLPTAELAAFGVDADLLRYCRATASGDRRVRAALAHFIAVNRDLYRQAEPGLDMLAPRVRPGLRVAFELYSGILAEVEHADYRILHRRIAVPRRRRIAVAVGELARGR